jgi:hypothetical protein
MYCSVVPQSIRDAIQEGRIGFAGRKRPVHSEPMRWLIEHDFEEVIDHRCYGERDELIPSAFSRIWTLGRLFGMSNV